MLIIQGEAAAHSRQKYEKIKKFEKNSNFSSAERSDIPFPYLKGCFSRWRKKKQLSLGTIFVDTLPTNRPDEQSSMMIFAVYTCTARDFNLRLPNPHVPYYS